MFKVSRGLSPEIVNQLFQFMEQISYKLRQRLQFLIPWAYSVFSATESLKLLGLKVLTAFLFPFLFVRFISLVYMN